jgi:Tfp pilus assembly protein FimT
MSRSDPSRRARRRPRGLSLLEPLVAVSLLTALVVLGAPPIVPVVERAVAVESAIRVHTALTEARARALATHRCHRLHVIDDERGRTALAVFASDHGACDDAEGVRVRQLALPDDVRVSTADALAITGSGSASEATVTVGLGTTTATVRLLASGASCVEGGPPSVDCPRLE